VADPIENIIGDYKAFAAQQRDRVASRGIDVTPYAVSHIAYRVPEWDEYIRVRGLLERHAPGLADDVADHQHAHTATLGHVGQGLKAVGRHHMGAPRAMRDCDEADQAAW